MYPHTTQQRSADSLRFEANGVANLRPHQAYGVNAVDCVSFVEQIEPIEGVEEIEHIEVSAALKGKFIPV